MNAYDSYRKIVDVINHNDNTSLHILAINQLIKNYANKFPEEERLLYSLFEYKCELEKKLEYER